MSDPNIGAIGVLATAEGSHRHLPWLVVHEADLRCGFAASSSDAKYDQELARAAAFEKTLVDDGALIVKHSGPTFRKKSKRRDLDALEASRKTRYRVSKHDLRHQGALRRPVDRQRTSHQCDKHGGDASWTVVESTDKLGSETSPSRARSCSSSKTVRSCSRAVPLTAAAATTAGIADPHTVLDTLDLSKKLESEEYNHRRSIAADRARLSRVQVNPTSNAGAWSSCSRAGMPRVRAARSVESRMRSTRGNTASFRSLHPPRKNDLNTTCGASYAASRDAGNLTIR